MTELETAQQRIAELEAELAAMRDGYRDEQWWLGWNAAMRAGGEPKAWIRHHHQGGELEWENKGGNCTPLYTHPQPDAQGACEWRLADADSGTWESACGESWSFIDGGPKENMVRFCQGCGKTLRIKGGQHADR